MATKKKLLQAAAGTAAAGGAGGLNVEQVFSTYLYEGNGGTQVIENGINLGQSNDGGSGYFNGTDTYLEADDALDFHTSSTSDITIEMFLNIDDGWTGVRCPFAINATDGSTNYLNLEVDPPSSGSGTFGLFSNNPSLNVTIGTYSVNTWHHIAVTYDGSSLKLYKDGTLVTTQSWTSDAAFSAHALNIGMETDSGNTAGNFYQGYMSNFRVSNNIRYSAAFTAPTSAFTSDANTELLTLQGDSPFVDNSSNSVAVTNTNTEPKSFGPFDAADAGEGGLVWIKSRTNTGFHFLFDTERGAEKALSSELTNGEISRTGSLTAFNGNGFSVGSFAASNGSGQDYTSWSFKKRSKFFDVVTWTGDGVQGRQIAHNLGTNVGMWITKKTTGTSNWSVWHRGLSNTSQNYLFLNATNAEAGNTTVYNDTAPTSTHITVGNVGNLNTSGETYVAYLFAHHDGDGDFGPNSDQDIIKCGSYTGNGSATGPEIDLGFEPQWLLVKIADQTTAEWVLVDNMRGITSNASNSTAILKPNTSDAEITLDGANLTSTGFKIVTADTRWNYSGATYIYIAIRRGPMAVPESATDVFAIDTRALGSPGYTSNFPVDWFLYKNTTGSASTVKTRLTGKRIRPDDTSAEAGDHIADFQFNDGVVNSASALSTRYAWMWRRAPNFFDVVAYLGNGTAGRTVSHNLGVAPEMIWVKRRDSIGDWRVYHSGLDATAPQDKYINLNEDLGVSDSTLFWNDTAPTDSNFTLGSHATVNGSGGTYIAYLFASLDGVSKLGTISFTNGSTSSVDCGFSSGARFVLLKSTSATGGWWVFDTERGIVSGNDPYLQLNTTTAQNSSFDIIDPLSSGFQLSGNTLPSDTYIFYAVA